MKVGKAEFTAYLLTAVVSFAAAVVLFAVSGRLAVGFAAVLQDKISTVSGIADNALALADAVNMTGEEIERQLDENKEEIQNVLVRNDLPVINDLTPEEEAAVMSGEMSSEDVRELLVRKNSETNFFIYNTSEESSAVTEEAAAEVDRGDDIDASIGEKISELYSLKAYYLSMLGSMLSQAKAEYASMGGGSSSDSLAREYLAKAGNLEEECDSRVYAVLAELESELIQNGRDTSVVTSLEEAYLKEKRLKKSYYLTNYLD